MLFAFVCFVAAKVIILVKSGKNIYSKCSLYEYIIDKYHLAMYSKVVNITIMITNKPLDVAKRLKMVFKAMNIDTDTQAMALGFETTRAWYNCTSAKGITLERLLMALDKYPQISAKYVLTGKGDMLEKKSSLLNCCVTEEEADDMIDDMLPTTTYDEVEEVKPQDGVPYIHDAFGCGMEEYARQNMNDVEYIRVVGMPKTAFFCDAKGDSMAPLISNGDIVGMYEIPLSSYIPLGEIYGIETDEITTIKRLRKGNSPDTYILEPLNKEYDADEINKKDIVRIFKVTGCIKSF